MAIRWCAPDPPALGSVGMTPATQSSPMAGSDRPSNGATDVAPADPGPPELHEWRVRGGVGSGQGGGVQGPPGSVLEPLNKVIRVGMHRSNSDPIDGGAVNGEFTYPADTASLLSAEDEAEVQERVGSGWAHARWRRGIMRSMKFSPEIGTKNREDVPGEIKKFCPTYRGSCPDAELTSDPSRRCIRNRLGCT